jgi:hypothetical protein
VTFFALAVYLTAESIRDVIGQARPEHSVPGIAVTVAARIVMPALAVAKQGRVVKGLVAKSRGIT